MVFNKAGLQTGRFWVPTAIAGGTGPLIVGVNGAQQTMGSWRALVKFFVARGWRVLLFDFPGQGRGRIIEGGPDVSLDEQVEITRAVIDSISATAPVNLIGGSWGAVVGAATAARHPARVRQLVLGSFRTAPNPVILDMAARGRRYIEEGNLGQLADLFVQGFGRGLPESRRQQIYRQIADLAADQAANLHALSFLFADGSDISRHVDLRQITARTLIINGALDPIVDTDNLAHAASLVPDCRTLLVPQAGHFLHNELPVLLAVYERFFAGGDPTLEMIVEEEALRNGPPMFAA
jgi:pimeloyl-ACP methyl ester carboxylesterase